MLPQMIIHICLMEDLRFNRKLLLQESPFFCMVKKKKGFSFFSRRILVAVVFKIVSTLLGLGLGEFGPHYPAQQALLAQWRRATEQARLAKAKAKAKATKDGIEVQDLVDENPDKDAANKRKDINDP